MRIVGLGDREEELRKLRDEKVLKMTLNLKNTFGFVNK
jgi:hypothetical protein